MRMKYPDPNNIEYHPDVPYHGIIPGGLTPGCMITFLGSVPYGAKRFQIDFIKGDTVNAYIPESERMIVFHFNPRFNDKCIVRNSRLDGVWGNEERVPKAVPFTPGAHFEVIILVHPLAFKVAVNGKPCIEFKHRIPFEGSNVLSIAGDVHVDQIIYKKEGTMHHPSGSFTPSMLGSGDGPKPVFNPPLPLYQKFPEGLRVGQMIYVTGHPSFGFTDFRINFLRPVDGNISSPNTEVAFQFNPRSRENCVVRNSMLMGVWGREERAAPHFPFRSGTNFDLIIKVEVNKFMVAVNGQHYIEYQHRMAPLKAIQYLVIDGDVTISSVRFA